jgi:ADP-ribose pyrophosphatase
VESPEDCAIREVEEETGYRAGRLESLGWIWTTPGFTDEKIWLFAARDLTPTRASPQADEVLSVESMPLRDAVRRAIGGEIVDAKSVCALLRAASR